MRNAHPRPRGGRPGQVRPFLTLKQKQNDLRFVVHYLDKPGALPLRSANYEVHKSYLATSNVATVVSDPLLADDGGIMIGSMFIFETATKKDVVAFNSGKSFAKAGIDGL